MDLTRRSQQSDSLRARWVGAAGIERRRQVLAARFNLGTLGRVTEVAADEALSRDLRGIDHGVMVLATRGDNQCHTHEASRHFGGGP